MQLNKQLALEAIAYVAKRLPHPTYFFVGKALYFADKWSLERYGCFIYWDTYIAMDNGPVPSYAYDAMKSVAGDSYRNSEVNRQEVAQVLSATRKHGRVYIQPLRQADLDELSESDIQALEYGIAQCGNKSFGELSDISHDAAWDATPENQPMSVLDIARTLKQGDKIADHLEAFY